MPYALATSIALSHPKVGIWLEFICIHRAPLPAIKMFSSNFKSRSLTLRLLVASMCRSLDWYEVACPFSSKYGFQCLNLFADTFLALRCAVHVTMQCTHRWSNPMGRMLSSHTCAALDFGSPKMRSSCAQVSSKYIWHVQLSFMSCALVFFSRAFLTAERSVARTVLLVSLQACRHEQC